MTRVFRSFEEARRSFEMYARLDPELRALWDDCVHAGPPSLGRAESDDLDDPYDTDAFLVDPLADIGWCAEDFFLEQVKPLLVELVGAHRSTGPAELQTVEAYLATYRALLDWALARSCACCVERAAA
jgi:hypothetical protein